MNTLFIIDGAAGTGKSDLVEFVHFKNAHTCKIINKFTTRAKRKDDARPTKWLDITFITLQEFEEKKKAAGEENFYTYLYDNQWYGFYKKELDESISTFKNTFVIVRSRKIILQLIEDYQHIVDVVPVLIHSDRELVISRLQADGHSNEEINFRLARDVLVQREYDENGNVYEKTILNSSKKEDYHRKIYDMIDEYAVARESNDIIRISPNEKFMLIPELVAYKQTILNKLKKYPYEKNVFLMMKFRDYNRDFTDYIREELGRYGYNCVCTRNDLDDYDFNAEWNITDNVYNPIAAIYCCKYGIALFDEAEEGSKYSPNVAYELGIMHYQRKDCLILKHHELGDKPFDIIKNLHHEYKEKSDFRKIFKKWVIRISSQ